MSVYKPNTLQVAGWKENALARYLAAFGQKAYYKSRICCAVPSHARDNCSSHCNNEGDDAEECFTCTGVNGDH